MLKSNHSHHLYGFTDLKTLNERGPVVISQGKGIYVYDIYNKKTSSKKVGTKEFTNSIIDRLGQEPAKLPISNFKEIDKNSTKRTNIYREEVAKDKELIGFDLFIDWQDEFEDLILNGKIDVAQPDVGRCGGLTEAKKIAKFSQENNRIIVPHCWKTSVSISATANFAFNTSNCAFIEYLPPQLCVEILRKELATEGFDFADGKILPPTKPGLGIELNRDAIKKYQVA